MITSRIGYIVMILGLARLAAASNSLAHCEALDPKGSCIWCEDGYFLDQGACQPQNVKDCLVYVPNRNECAEFKNHGLVARRLAGTCVTWFIVCKKCSNLYYPNPLLLFSCSQISSWANCVTSDGKSNCCSACAPNYYVDCCSCKAITPVPYCATYHTNQNQCKTCLAGFTLSCNSCNHSNMNKCVDFDGATLKCTQCKSLFWVNPNGGCSAVTINKCKSSAGYLNQCQICKSNYYVTAAGQCSVQSLTNCQAYKPNENVCTCCVAPFVLINGLCEAKKNSNCQVGQYNSVTNKCLACVSLY